jgi:hypothetical protein
MPLTGSQLNRIVRHATIDFYDDTGTKIGDLNIVFRPNVFSKAEGRRFQAAIDAGEAEQDDGIAPLLLKSLARWDFRDSPDGPDKPITLETLAEIGHGVQVMIVRKLAEVAGTLDPTSVSNSAPPSEASEALTSLTEPRSLSSVDTGASLTHAY